MEPELAVKNKKVVYFLYTSPGSYPILGHAVRCLLADGWEVLVLGIGTTGTAANLQLKNAEGLQQKTLSPANAGLRQKIHFIYFAIWATWQAFLWKPDVIYCIERLAAPAALLSRLFLWKPILFHEYDPPQNPRSVFEQLLNFTRRVIAKRAVACVIPNEEREIDFRESLTPKKSMMVWNAVSTTEIKSERENRIGSEPLCLWYQGAINAGQFPETLAEAVASVPDVILKFVGFSSAAWKDYPSKIIDRAQELGAVNRVQYLGTPATREELYKLSEAGHVGLILFKIPFRDPMAGASQKAFEYMAAGMPLLVPDIPEWQRFVVDNGFGRACDPGDPDSIAEQIRWFVEHAAEAKQMGIQARKKIVEEWNYENLFQPVISVLNDQVKTKETNSMKSQDKQ